MLIGFGGDMTSIDFRFTMSKVEVKKNRYVRNGFTSFPYELLVSELSYKGMFNI